MERRNFPKSIRFEVLKRDKFQCVYCGAAAPGVLLQVDHIHPVSKGGTDDLLNLATSCADCNLGKSNKLLSDDSAITKKTQLDDLQERREQLEMMVEWQQDLAGLQDREIDEVCSFYESLVPGFRLNQDVRPVIARLLQEQSLATVLAELRSSCAKHLRTINGEPTRESAAAIWVNCAKNVYYLKYKESDPVGAELRYIRGILRNRLRYCHEEQALELLQDAHSAGISTEKLKQLALRARSWTNWKKLLSTLLNEET